MYLYSQNKYESKTNQYLFIHWYPFIKFSHKSYLIYENESQSNILCLLEIKLLQDCFHTQKKNYSYL